MVRWKEQLEEVFEIPYYSSSSPPPELDDTSSSFEDEGSLEEIPLEPQQTSNRLEEDLPLDFGEGQRLEGFYNASFMQAGDESWDGTEQTYSSRSSGGGNNVVYTGMMAESILRLTAYMAPYATRFVGGSGDDPDVESDALYGAAPIWTTKDNAEAAAAQPGAAKPGAATSANATSSTTTSTATSTATTSITSANTVATSFPVNVSPYATSTIYHTAPLVGASNGSGGATAATSMATANNATAMGGSNLLSTTTTTATSQALTTTINAAALKNIAATSTFHGSGTSTAGAVTASGVSTLATANTTAAATGQGIASAAAGVANTGVRMGATKFLTATASVATPPVAPTNAIVNPILAHMAVAAGKNAASSISSGISAVTAAAPGAFGAAAGIGATAAGGVTTSSSIVASTTTIAAVAAVAAGAVATAVSIPLLNKTMETSQPSSFSFAPSPVGTSLVSVVTSTFTPWQSPTATPSIFINTILPDASPRNTLYPTMFYENPSNNPAFLTWEPTDSLGTNLPTLYYSDAPSQVPSSPLISVTYLPSSEVSSQLTPQKEVPVSSFLPTPSLPPSIIAPTKRIPSQQPQFSVVPSQNALESEPASTLFPISSQAPSEKRGTTSDVPTGFLNASVAPVASSASPSTLEPTIVSPASASPVPSVRPSDYSTGLPSIFRQSDVPTNITAATLQPTVTPSVLQNSTSTPTSIPSDITTLIPTVSPLESLSPSFSSASPSTSEPTIRAPASSSPIPTSIPSDITTSIPSITQRSDVPTNSTGSPPPTANPSLTPSFVTFVPSDFTTLIPSEIVSNISFAPTPSLSMPSSIPSSITSESPVTLGSDAPTYSASEPTVQAVSRSPTTINTIFTQSVSPTVSESSSIPSSTPSEERIQTTDAPSRLIQSLSSVPSSNPTSSVLNNTTKIPSDRTTEYPTPSPSKVSALPSISNQTTVPTIVPSDAPANPLSAAPQLSGSSTPSSSLTDFPTVLSSEAPSGESTSVSSLSPSTLRPSNSNNSGQPSILPSEPIIISEPSFAPSNNPTLQSISPSAKISVGPTYLLSYGPSVKFLDQPSGVPSTTTKEPILVLSQTPAAATLVPSKLNPLSTSPSVAFTSIPISVQIQSLQPSSMPSGVPSVTPTASPSNTDLLTPQPSAPALQSRSPTQVTGGNPGSSDPATSVPTFGSSILGSDNTFFATGAPSSMKNSASPSSQTSNPIVTILPSTPTLQTSQPSISSLVSPTYKPTVNPSSSDPTVAPFTLSLSPSLGVLATSQPIEIPSLSPQIVVDGTPTATPTVSPQALPFPTPTIEPTLMYTPQPSVAATLTPLSPIGDESPTVEPTLQYKPQPTIVVTSVNSNSPVSTSVAPTSAKAIPSVTQSPFIEPSSLQPSASRPQLSTTSMPSPLVSDTNSPLVVLTNAPTDLQGPIPSLPPSLALSANNPGTNPLYQSSPTKLPTSAPSSLSSVTYPPSPSATESPNTYTGTYVPSFSVPVSLTSSPTANPTEGPSTNPSNQFATVPSVQSIPPTSASAGASTVTPVVPTPGTVPTFTPTIEATLQYTLQPSSVVSSGTEAPSSQSLPTDEPSTAITKEPNLVPSIISSFVPVGLNSTIENSLRPSESPVVVATDGPFVTLMPTLKATFNPTESPEAGTTFPSSVQTLSPSVATQTDIPIATLSPSIVATDLSSMGTIVPYQSPSPTMVSSGTITSNPAVPPPVDTVTTEPTLQYTPLPTSFVTYLPTRAPVISQSPLTDGPSIAIAQGPNVVLSTTSPSISVTLETTLSPIESPFGRTTSSPLSTQTSSPSINIKTDFPFSTTSPSSPVTALSSRATAVPSVLRSPTPTSASSLTITLTPVLAPQTEIVTTLNPTIEPSLQYTPQPSNEVTSFTEAPSVFKSLMPNKPSFVVTQSPFIFTSTMPLSAPVIPNSTTETTWRPTKFPFVVTTNSPLSPPSAAPTSSVTNASSQLTMIPSVSLRSLAPTKTSAGASTSSPVAPPEELSVTTSTPTVESTLQYTPEPSNSVTGLVTKGPSALTSLTTEKPFIASAQTVIPSFPMISKATMSPNASPDVEITNSPWSSPTVTQSSRTVVPSNFLQGSIPSSGATGALTASPVTNGPSALTSLTTDKPFIASAQTVIPSSPMISKATMSPNVSPDVEITNSPWSSPTVTQSSRTVVPSNFLQGSIPSSDATGTSTASPGVPPSPTAEWTSQNTPQPSAFVIVSTTEAPLVSPSLPTDNPSTSIAQGPNSIVTPPPSSAATDLSSMGTIVSIEDPIPTFSPIDPSQGETTTPSIRITQTPFDVTPTLPSSDPVVSNSTKEATFTPSKLSILPTTSSPWSGQTNTPAAVGWINTPVSTPFPSSSPTHLSSLGTIVSIESPIPSSVRLGTMTLSPVVQPQVGAISTLVPTTQSTRNSAQPSNIPTLADTSDKTTLSPSIPIMIPSVPKSMSPSLTKLSVFGNFGFHLSNQPISPSLVVVTERPSLAPHISTTGIGIPHQSTSSFSRATSTPMLLDNPGEDPTISEMPSSFPYARWAKLPPILSSIHDSVQGTLKTPSGIQKISPSLPPNVGPSSTLIFTEEPILMHTMQPTPFINVIRNGLSFSPFVSSLSSLTSKPSIFMTQLSLRGMSGISPSGSSTPSASPVNGKSNSPIVLTYFSPTLIPQPKLFVTNVDALSENPTSELVDSLIASRGSLLSPAEKSTNVVFDNELPINQLTHKQPPIESFTKSPSSPPFSSHKSDLSVANLRGTAQRVLTPRINDPAQGNVFAKESSESIQSSYLRHKQLPALPPSFYSLRSRGFCRIENAILSPLRKVFKRVKLCFPFSSSPSIHYVRRKRESATLVDCVDASKLDLKL